MNPSPPARLGRRVTPGIVLAVVILAGAVFAFVAQDVVRDGPLATLDVELARWLHVHATHGFVVAMLLVAQAHSTVAVSAYGVLAVALLWTDRARRDAFTVFVAIAGVLVLNVLLKLAFHRARPVFDDPVLTLPTYSFPSGHVAASTVFYGLLVAWAFRHVHGTAARSGVAVLAIATLALVGMSRMVLGVHYLTDVIGASAEGVAWLAVCFGARTAWQGRSPPDPTGSDSNPLVRRERHG
jgi:undecaprenyl-diphosphatase